MAKVEVRSLTGAEYTRAGKRWSPQWTELDESGFTRQQRKQLSEDPHLEFRVGGRRIRKDGSAAEHETADDRELALRTAHLASSVDALTAQNTSLAAKVATLDEALTKANAENAKLAAKVAEYLDALAKAKAPASVPVAPPAETPPAPSAPVAELAKGSKAKT